MFFREHFLLDSDVFVRFKEWFHVNNKNSTTTKLLVGPLSAARDYKRNLPTTVSKILSKTSDTKTKRVTISFLQFSWGNWLTTILVHFSFNRVFPSFQDVTYASTVSAKASFFIVWWNKAALTINCPNIGASTKIFVDKCLISRHLTVIHENIPGLLGYFKTHASNNIDGWIVIHQN